MTLLDAPALGGVPSNRRLGVDKARGGPPSQHSPGSSGIQSAAGPRASTSVKRERELRGPGRELKIKAGSRPGLRGCTPDCNGADCRAEYSPPLPFLIIDQQFAAALARFDSLLYRFNSTRSSFHFKGTSKDCERIRRPSRSACLRRFVKLVPLPWRVSDMSGDEKCPGVECHTSHFSKIFAR